MKLWRFLLKRNLFKGPTAQWATGKRLLSRVCGVGEKETLLVWQGAGRLVSLRQWRVCFWWQRVGVDLASGSPLFSARHQEVGDAEPPKSWLTPSVPSYSMHFFFSNHSLNLTVSWEKCAFLFLTLRGFLLRILLSGAQAHLKAQRRRFSTTLWWEIDCKHCHCKVTVLLCQVRNPEALSREALDSATQTVRGGPVWEVPRKWTCFSCKYKF